MRLYGADITGSLQITGSISLSGSFKDQESSPGTAGQVLSSTVSGSQWVDVGGSGIGDVTKTGTIVANQIAIWNNTTNQLRSDPTFVIDSNYKITLYQPRVSGGSSNIDSYNIGGGNLANVTGGNNAGFGNNNLFNITTGQQNTAFGNQSLYNNTEGLLNTAIGHTALYSNTTGGNNIAIGNQALYSNTEGSNNIGIGVFSVLNNTTGIKNIGIGRNSLSSTTGDGNIAIGFEAGKNITTGDNNVIIGTNTGSTIATSDNNIIISDGSGNNRIQVDSGGNVGIGTSSIEGKLTLSYTAAELPSSGTTSNSAIQIISSLNNQLNIGLNTVSGNYGSYIQASDNNLAVSYPLNLQPNGGNVGVGGTPSTWSTLTGLQVKNASLAGFGNSLYLTQNTFYDGTAWKYIANDFASKIQADQGMTFSVASSGTAPNAITWIDALTISSGGDATFSGNVNATNASSTVNIIATGINSGTNGGSTLIAGTTGVTNIAIGNKSAILGGAFDATSMVYWGNGGSLVFNNAADRLTITSGGDVILGPYNATPASTYNKYYYIKSAPYFWNCGNTYNPNYEIAAIAMGAPGPGQDDGEILFQTAQNVCSNNASSVLTTRARILETGEFEMYNGIKFPNQSAGSGTVSSSTLDAYEEGTWTPVVKFGTTVNNVGTIRALYTRIGRVVYIQCTMTSITLAGTGNLSIEGLPYTVGGNAFGDTQGNFRWGGIALSGAATHISAYFAQGGSNFFPQIIGTSGYISPVTNSGVSSTWNIYGISGFYMI